MTEQLLAVLKICLLILLYLFFFRVLRAVWAELRDPLVAPTGPTPRPTRATESPSPPRPPRVGMARLVVVEPSALAGAAHSLRAEMTIGRAPGCTIVVDDQFVSTVHTRIFERDGAWMVEDLGSTNGTYLNRHKVTGPVVFHLGDRIQIGNVVLEAR